MAENTRRLLRATDPDTYPGQPIATANPAHQPIVPVAGGVPPYCSCGVIGGDGRSRPLLADHLREMDPTYARAGSNRHVEQAEPVMRKRS